MSKPSEASEKVVRKRRLIAGSCWALALLCAGGCDDQLPPMANPQQARMALETALDTWQKGETEESLQTQAPAIFVNDPDWRANAQLVEYQIQSEKAHGNSWACEVLLTLKNSDGNKTRRQATYTIDTDPALVVVRD